MDVISFSANTLNIRWHDATKIIDLKCTESQDVGQKNGVSDQKN